MQIRATLPSCALECYITALTTSSVCPTESDLRCHCDTSGGNILEVVESCVGDVCNEEDKSEAKRVISGICEAVDSETGGAGGGGENTGSEGTSTASATTPTPTISNTPLVDSTRSEEQTSMSSSSVPFTISIPPDTSSSTETSETIPTPMIPTPTIPTPTTSSTATSLPLAPVPSHSLPTAAKAGIALSLTLLFALITLFMVLYIRRLKRSLRTLQLQAATTASMAEHEESYDSGPGIRTSSGGIGGSFRRQYHSSGRGSSSESPLSPVSPLSPRSMFDASHPNTLQKKRGAALSLIIERVDEDDRSSSGARTGRSSTVREPVPGQREGLAEPLELDSQGIVEMPLSVTPRARSRERGRSFGGGDG